MLPLCLVALALAAPPSSTLQGDAGTLSWQVAQDGDGITVKGTSPKWKVEHAAGQDLRPRRTSHTDAAGVVTTVTWDANGATVQGPKGTTRFDKAGLWDADTVDIRLGDRIARGQGGVVFEAIDVAGPKVYEFEARVVGQETCGAQPCTHVQLQLTGLLRWVGPTWEYWFAADGKLLRFEGPIGDYRAW